MAKKRQKPVIPKVCPICGLMPESAWKHTRISRRSGRSDGRRWWETSYCRHWWIWHPEKRSSFWYPSFARFQAQLRKSQHKYQQRHPRRDKRGQSKPR